MIKDITGPVELTGHASIILISLIQCEHYQLVCLSEQIIRIWHDTGLFNPNTQLDLSTMVTLPSRNILVPSSKDIRPPIKFKLAHQEFVQTTVANIATPGSLTKIKSKLHDLVQVGLW